MAFDPSTVANRSALALYYLDEARLVWAPLPGGRVSAAGVFSAPLAHFSRYALLELVDARAAAPPAAAAGGGNSTGPRAFRSGQWAGARVVLAEGISAAVLLGALFVASLMGCPLLQWQKPHPIARKGAEIHVVSVSAATPAGSDTARPTDPAPDESKGRPGRTHYLSGGNLPCRGEEAGSRRAPIPGGGGGRSAPSIRPR